MADWQTIDTAPRDAADGILGYYDAVPGIYHIAWDGGEWVSFDGYITNFHQPCMTHWRPLPAPPRKGTPLPKGADNGVHSPGGPAMTTDPIAAARALIAAQPDLLFRCDLCSEECNCHPHHDMSMSGEHILCDQCEDFDNPKGVPDPLTLIATLADALEAERADAEKWREAAGAHHVAAMKEAEKWFAVSAERDELRTEFAKALVQNGDLKITLAETQKQSEAELKQLSKEKYMALVSERDARSERDHLRSEVERLNQEAASYHNAYEQAKEGRDQALARLAAAQMGMRERCAEKLNKRFGKPHYIAEEIRAIPIDTDAQAALDKLLGEARLEGWRDGRDAAACEAQSCTNDLYVVRAIRALPEPMEASHDD